MNKSSNVKHKKRTKEACKEQIKHFSVAELSGAIRSEMKKNLP